MNNLSKNKYQVNIPPNIFYDVSVIKIGLNWLNFFSKKYKLWRDTQVYTALASVLNIS